MNTFQDRFRPYYVPGLVGLMYFHWLDTVDMLNQWLDPLPGGSDPKPWALSIMDIEQILGYLG